MTNRRFVSALLGALLCAGGLYAVFSVTEGRLLNRDGALSVIEDRLLGPDVSTPIHSIDFVRVGPECWYAVQTASGASQKMFHHGRLTNQRVCNAQAIGWEKAQAILKSPGEVVLWQVPFRGLFSSSVTLLTLMMLLLALGGALLTRSLKKSLRA